jgi:hypothetical protein
VKRLAEKVYKLEHYKRNNVERLAAEANALEQ